MNPFEMQDIYCAKLIEAFDRGMLNQAFQPYIDWKIGQRGQLAEDEIQEMRIVASVELDALYDAYPEAYKGVTLDEPFFGAWRGYGRDAEKAAFLDSIKAELDSIYVLLYA